MHICNALAHYGYEEFSLSILQYINVFGLSKEEARKLILSYEQDFLNSLYLEFNKSPTTGSCLETIASAETKAKLSLAKSGENNPFFGKTHSTEILAKMSKAKRGTIFSAETRTKMSKAKLGGTLSAETRAKMSEAKLGETRSAKTKTKISAIKGTTIFIYDLQS